MFLVAIALLGFVGLYLGHWLASRNRWTGLLIFLFGYGIFVLVLSIQAEAVVVGPRLESVIVLAFYLLPICLGLAIGGAAGAVRNWIRRDQETDR